MGINALVNRSVPRPRDPQLDDLELRTSQQLVAIIDILLGLTLVEGAVAFRSMFTQSSTANAPAIIAMVLVYYTAIRSFIDWHIAMEVRPYRILTEKVRDKELRRVFLDFAIMASYSFLILRAHTLIQHPGSDITAIAITYAAIYLAYIIWGKLREHAKQIRGVTLPSPFAPGLLIATLTIAGLLLAGYVIGRSEETFGLSKADFNTVFLALELLLIAWYRHENWVQQMVLNGPEAHRESLGKRFIQAIDKEKAANEQKKGVERVKQMNALHAGVEKVDEALLGQLIEQTHRR